jgi:hypothetical protein
MVKAAAAANIHLAEPVVMTTHPYWYSARVEESHANSASSFSKTRQEERSDGASRGGIFSHFFPNFPSFQFAVLL